MMKAADFAAACKRTATNYKTAYMLGTFGWPATAANISRAIKSNGTNAVRPAWQSDGHLRRWQVCLERRSGRFRQRYDRRVQRCERRFP